MEIKGYFKNLKITPKKLRFLLPEIKELSPAEALDRLYYSRQKPAQFFYKAIASVVASAKNTFKIDSNLLKFKLLTVEEGRTLKRMKPGGRGAGKPINREFAHIKIILEATTPRQQLKKEVKAVQAIPPAKAATPPVKKTTVKKVKKTVKVKAK